MMIELAEKHRRDRGLLALLLVLMVWEIVEWLYAAIDGGEVGAAFLGSQGDVWDAQKDILCDTLGALCAAVSYWVGRRTRLTVEIHE